MPRPKRKSPLVRQSLTINLPEDVDKSEVVAGLEAIARDLNLCYRGNPSISALIVALSKHHVVGQSSEGTITLRLIERDLDS